MKPQARVLTLSAGRSLSRERKWLIGTVYRGRDWFEGLMKFSLNSEQGEVAETIIANIQKSRHYSQIRLILLDSLRALPRGHFDLARIYQRTGIPVIVMEKRLSARRRVSHRHPAQEATPVPTADHTVVRTEHGKFSLYSLGLKPVDITDFVRAHLEDGRIPSILSSTREIANAYNAFMRDQED